MREKSGTMYKAGLGFGIGAVIFTILVKLIDVQPIGPNGTSIGFAKLNGAIFAKTGFNEKLYDFTEILGYLTFLVVAFFACMGAYQLFKTRKLMLVDKRIRALGVFYIIVGIFYLLFTVVAVNYRPVILEGELEPSFPSSHTMLACCVFLSAIVMIHEMMDAGALRIILKVICILALAAIVIGRTLCGVHWLTDIVAGILISLMLVFLFRGVIEKQKEIGKARK